MVWLTGDNFFMSKIVLKKPYLFAGIKTHLPVIKKFVVLGDNTGKLCRMIETINNFLYFPANTVNTFDVAG